MLLGAFSVCFGDGRWKEGRRTVGGCGLSGQVWRVGQGNWRRRVVCRDKYGEWVKRPVAGMWSVGASMASGSKELSLECGLSVQVWRVGQGNWRRRVVCRVKFVAWVKGIVGACGLSGQVCCVGQGNWRRRVVCRVKIGEWVKRPVAGMWSVGASMASGSKELFVACGLSGQVWRVGQGNCRWVWSVGTSMASGSRGLSAECGLSA